MQCKGVEVSGPFFEYSAPYGKAIDSMDRDKWFVSVELSEDERKTPMQKLLKATCIGTITRFRNKPRTFIIGQLFPRTQFNSLKRAVAFLVDNRNKIVFCS